MNRLFSGTTRLGNRLLPGLALSLLLLAAGCETLILTPTSSGDLRELYKSRKATADKFMVNRPFAVVVRDLKTLNDKCMDKVLPLPAVSAVPGQPPQGSGFVHYVPGSAIQADRAEFYVKKRVIQPGASSESGDQYIYYVVDVVAQGSLTAVRIIYANTEVQRWARPVKGWAMGEDSGCPVPNPVN